MPDLDERNPYPEDEPRLRESWEEGFRACQKGTHLNESPEENLGEEARAWLDGYKAAKSGGY